MHYPVNVFTGKVREYDGSRPSAIAKVQVDGELSLTELGLVGDQQAEKKIADWNKRVEEIKAILRKRDANYTDEQVKSVRDKFDAWLKARYPVSVVYRALPYLRGESPGIHAGDETSLTNS